MNPLKRLVRGVLRLAAGLAVIAIIAGPVVVMATVAGNPLGGDLIDALSSRDIDNEQIIKLMSIAFYVLWAWFAIPALRQAAITLSAPRTPGRTRTASTPPSRVITRPAASIPADEAGPRGWLARLVRFALGAATVAATMTSVTTGWVPSVSAAPAPVTSVVDDTAKPHVAPTPAEAAAVDRGDRVNYVTAERRDTPYSIARRLFPNNVDDARDEILELNTGRMTPSGTTWSSGNFPAGMNVITPYADTGPDTDDAPTVNARPGLTYRVRANDGWINVVEGLWGPDAGDRWQELRLELVGQQVALGVVVTGDITTIHPGWVFTRPATPAASSPAAVDDVHVVERGDTLYEIVDDVVDEPVTSQHIATVARHNDGMATPDGIHVFSADNPDLIHPGQVVHLAPIIDTEPDPAPTPDSTTTDPAIDTEPEPLDATAPADSPRVDEPAASPADADPSPSEAGDAAPGRDLDAPRRDDPAAPPVDSADVDTTPTRPPAPVVTSPAPPVPVPTNAITATPTQPGDAAATPPVIDTPPAETDGSTRSTAPYALLAAGGLGLAGLFLALDRRRRKARAKRPTGTSIAAPDPIDTETEHIMRTAAHVDRATRVNLAVRHLGRQLAERDAPLRAHYLLATTDTVTAVFDRPVELEDGWIDDTANNNGWTCTLDDDHLALFADDPSPWPALVPIGTLDDGTDLLVDIEGLGTLAVNGPDDIVDRFLAAIVTAISSSPYADLLTFVDDRSIALHGLDQHLQHRLAVDSIDSLIDRLGSWIAPFDFDDQHLLAARHELGAEFEPCIAALVTTLDDAQRSKLADLPLDGSQPIALLTTDINLAGTVLDLDDDGTTVIDGHRVHCHRLEPVTATTAATLFDVVDTPTIVDTTPLDELDRLTQSIPSESPEADEPDIDEPAGNAAPTVAPAIAVANTMLPPIPGQLFNTDPDVDWTIRVLGPLEIVHHDGTHLNGPKIRELATLIAMHPAGVPTAELSRMLGGTPKAALASRVSELRRLLGHGDGETGRTYLPANNGARGYHLEGVHVDSVRLARCLDQARSAHGQDKINWLVGALELVRGQIGTGEFTSFQWAGHLMTTLEASITDAGVELVTLAAEHEQWQIVDWAANQVRLANPYEQRVFPVQIEARRAMGDEVGIRRLHDEALDDVDEFEPDVAAAFHNALARHAH